MERVHPSLLLCSQPRGGCPSTAASLCSQSWRGCSRVSSSVLGHGEGATRATASVLGHGEGGPAPPPPFPATRMAPPRRRLRFQPRRGCPRAAAYVPGTPAYCPEGIETLCSHLEVPHTDVRILMLAWKMGCEKQGYFTSDEWRTGLKALRADSISKLKKAFPELVQENLGSKGLQYITRKYCPVNTSILNTYQTLPSCDWNVTRPSNFQDFYAYAFRYCLTEDKKKCIEIPVACELLNLVLGLQFRPQVDKLINYLKHQNDYKVINMDQWMGFQRFCNEINFPSLDNYDPDQAWPLILDNFVEWLRANKN